MNAYEKRFGACLLIALLAVFGVYHLLPFDSEMNGIIAGAIGLGVLPLAGWLARR